jgi:hypothetical protein
MISTDDLAILRAGLDHDGLVRDGGKWVAGKVRAERGQIGRLIRAGFLVGKRRGHRVKVSPQGRRACAVGAMPAPNVEIVFRCDLGGIDRSQYHHGRVIASDDRRVVVALRGDGPTVIEVSRPHPGAHWKGSTRRAGAYRGTSLWPTVEAWPGLLPASWFAPLAAPPRTLARLQEVRARLASIGAYAMTTEERASDALYGGLHALRRAAANAMPDVAAYLSDVIAHDAAEVEDAEWEHAQKQVTAHVMPALYGFSRVSVPSLYEVKEALRCYRLRPEHVERAYAEALPRAEERAARVNELLDRRSRPRG